MDLISIAFAFVAGILMFFAPCTLPLVPGYLTFISGASISDLQDPKKAKKVRWKVFMNGVFYVLGFSSVFIVFIGILLGLYATVFGPYQSIITRIGGGIVVFFGIFLMLQAINALTDNRFSLMRFALFRFLSTERHSSFTRRIKPGSPLSSFLFGASFAFGWSPCVGPILSGIFFLASATTTLVQGAFLLVVFSVGLAVPFLLTALAIGWSTKYFVRIGKYLNWIGVIGGVFLIFLGYLMLADRLILLNGFIFEFLSNVGLEEYNALFFEFGEDVI